jgi:hypothetical protein
MATRKKASGTREETWKDFISVAFIILALMLIGLAIVSF